ncbi:MAG TPA: hypothetical protein VFA19_15000 [Gaiellaceae bacterium]|nr:hypothetical protein [Gaiellaceae bacterium]
MRITLPTALTPPAVAVGLLAAVLPGEAAGTRAAGAVAALCLAAGYSVWRVRGRRMHDDRAILVLLPAVPAAVWLAVGGLALDRAETPAHRLALEVGPGLALAGLTAAILGYHGRHDPRR